MPVYEGVIFDPPAPVVRAKIIGPRSELGDVPLLIDSGSDASTLPASVVQAIGAEIAPSGIALVLIDPRQMSTGRVEVVVEFLRFRIRGPFLVAGTDYGVLGRNVLNALKLVLDGPRQEWSAPE